MPQAKSPSPDVLVVDDLRIGVEEAREALSAIRSGQVDALVVRQGQGQEILLLKGAEQAYQVLYETLNEGAATLGDAGMVLYANRRFSELCAAPTAEVRGKPLSCFVAADDATILAALLAEAERGSSKGELHLTRPDGTTLPVLISMRRVEAPQTLVSVVVSDLSQIRETQDALQRAHDRLAGAIESLRAEMSRRERLEADLRQTADALCAADRRKDEFLAMLAHELRNPLGPILNAVELLRTRLQGDPDGERHRRVIERQARHMARLVDDLLEVSRITGGTIALRKERVDLAQLVRTAVEDAQPSMKQHDHAVVMTLPAGPVWVEADPTRLEQVLLNLLNNAGNYTPRGGRVEVVVASQGKRARVSVRDNGVGIEPELLPHVFDLFVQGERSLARSRGGMGLGLTLVRRLVELHGGTVRAESAGPNRGSVFTIELPLARSGAARVSAPPEAKTPSPTPSREGGPALRVLLIEDSVDAAEMMADLVRSWGHEARVAFHGDDGLRAADTYGPDVVLIDLGLPGIDGYEVARRLRALESSTGALRRLHLICVTGYGQAWDRQRAQEAGFDSFLVKPVDPGLLRRTLEELARRRRERAGFAA